MSDPRTGSGSGTAVLRLTTSRGVDLGIGAATGSPAARTSGTMRGGGAQAATSARAYASRRRERSIEPSLEQVMSHDEIAGLCSSGRRGRRLPAAQETSDEAKDKGQSAAASMYAAGGPIDEPGCM